MAKVTADEETRIVALIDQGKARNEIAREVERSASTITGIATKHGRSFDRSATKTATAAKAADNDARIEALLQRALSAAEKEYSRLDALDRGERYRLVKVSAGQVIDRMVSTAPEEDRQRMHTTAAIQVDKAKVLRSMKSDAREGKTLIERFVDGLAEAS